MPFFTILACERPLCYLYHTQHNQRAYDRRLETHGTYHLHNTVTLEYMNVYQRIIDLTKLTDPTLVLDELIRTSGHLRDTNLQQLAPFNSVYITMTRNLQVALHDNTFKENLIIEQLIINFANLYFSVLNASAKNKRVPEAWYATINARSQFFPYLVLLGANAHINYDLPVALKTTVPEPSTFHDDFLLINKIIAKTVRDTLDDHRAKNTIEKLIMGSQFLYAKPVIHGLTRWRTKVWSRYALY